MISIEDALQAVLRTVRSLDAETISFERADRRLLRDAVRSDIDMPPFPRSAVEGFALIADDVVATPRELAVIGEIPAGTFPKMTIRSGECASIMTGAPVPEGADAVQMVEQSRRIAPNRIEITNAVAAGANIAPRGSEVRQGDVVLSSAKRLDPAAIAVAASVGAVRLSVGTLPTVAIAATGDELVDPSETPGPGQIRNSNGYSLAAQVRAAGYPVVELGVAGDSLDSLRPIIAKGLSHEVLLLSGGVSMGSYDLVEDVLEEFGIDLLFDAIALKPGKPLVFGVQRAGERQPPPVVFGLPGNPVSTMVTFELFVRPALAAMEGAPAAARPLLGATLTAPLHNKGRRRAYLPGRLTLGEDGHLIATPVPTRGSGDIVAYSKANALLVVPETSDSLDTGEPVRCHPLDSFLLGHGGSPP